MARIPVNPPADGASVVFRRHDWERLSDHLFSGRHERGAVVLAEQVAGPRGPRFLVRTVIPAIDGVDYVPGTTGFRALKAAFVRDCANLAADNQLTYIAVHNHGGYDRVGFSKVDLDSQRRGYPALVQLTGQPVIGLVLTSGAAAGRVWFTDSTIGDLGEVVVAGRQLMRLRPAPFEAPGDDIRWDRQARVFGDTGQALFNRMRVAIVGLGGAGSLINEYCARLGVGHLVLIDADTVDVHNLPRLVGAVPDDIGEAKVSVAARSARRASPGVVVDELAVEVQHPSALAALRDSDFIFLSADSHAARHYVNETVERALIPGVQIGVKVPVLDDGTVGRIHTVVRPLIPGAGCLWCNHLVDANKLAIDLADPADREAARYVPEVPAPSVIALNAVPAADAVNKFMLGATGLLDNEDQDYLFTYPREGHDELREPRRDPACRWCGDPAGLDGHDASEEAPVDDESAVGGAEELDCSSAAPGGTWLSRLLLRMFGRRRRPVSEAEEEEVDAEL